MKSPDATFQLVKSLSKQEKWYFKAFAKWNALQDDSNYIRLFDLLNAAAVYDEPRIKQKLKNHSLSTSFAETKYQLHQNILKSLHFYHLASTADTRLKTLTHQVEILFNKALYEQAMRLIQRGKSLANEYEKLTALLDLLEWERMTVLYSFEQQHMNEALTRIRAEKATLLEILQNQSDYSDLGDRLFLLHQKSGVVRDKKTLRQYQAIMRNPLLQNVALARSLEAKAWFYQCHKFFAFAMQDSKSYHTYSVLHVQVQEEKPQLIDEKMTRYIGSLYTLAMAQSDRGQNDEFLQTIAKMRSIPERYKSGKLELNRLKIFEQTYREELSYYWYSGQFEKGNAIADAVLEGISRYRHLLTGHAFLLFYYELAKIKFGVKRYNESLDFINHVIQQPASDTREDIVAVLRILQLIIHFELGNNLLLPYIIKSTYRYLYKKERLYKTETLILHYLRKLERVRTSKDLLNSFRTLRGELFKLTKDPYEKIGLEYFDFIAWLDSKIEKKEFAAIVRKKATAH